MSMLNQPEIIIAIVTSTTVITYFLFMMPIKTIIQFGTVDEEVNEKAFGGIVFTASIVYFILFLWAKEFRIAEMAYTITLLIVYLIIARYFQNIRKKVLLGKNEYISNKKMMRIWSVASMLVLMILGLINIFIAFNNIEKIFTISTSKKFLSVIKYCMFYLITVLISGNLYGLNCLNDFKQFKIIGENLIGNSDRMKGYIIGKCDDYVIVKPTYKWDNVSKKYNYCGKSKIIFIKKDNISMIIPLNNIIIK